MDPKMNFENAIMYKNIVHTSAHKKNFEYTIHINNCGHTMCKEMWVQSAYIQLSNPRYALVSPTGDLASHIQVTAHLLIQLVFLNMMT